jgi:hypothetical protein
MMSEGLDAAMSPDSKWIVLTAYENRIGTSKIISIETGEEHSNSASLFDAVFWSK